MRGTPCSYDRSGQFLGELTSNNSRVILKPDEISLSMQHAIVAIEDRRFYQNSGVDLKGIGRALFQDVVERKAVQGGSTIAQQFVKTALAAQDQRTILQKAARGRAGLPPHAQVVEGEDPHRVPELDLLRQRRVRDRVGRAHVLRQPSTTAAAAAGGAARSELTPAEAALLAGVVSSPSMYDPVANPVAAKKRRDLVLLRCASRATSRRTSTSARSRRRCRRRPTSARPPSARTARARPTS